MTSRIADTISCFTGLASDVDVRSVEAYKIFRMSKNISPCTMNSELIP
jgi:hypothetical protein